MTEVPNRSESADVELEIVASNPQPLDELERIGFGMLELLESDVADIALGPAVAINLEKSAIDVRFVVEAGSKAAINQQVAKVMEALETVLAPSDEVRTMTSPTLLECVALPC